MRRLQYRPFLKKYGKYSGSQVIFIGSIELYFCRLSWLGLPSNLLALRFVTRTDIILHFRLDLSGTVWEQSSSEEVARNSSALGHETLLQNHFYRPLDAQY